MKDNTTFDSLYSIVSYLRSPDGCPWDRKQTLASMISSLIEESYETVSAIQENDVSGIKEELGDVLLIVSMLMRICEEDSLFNSSEVFTEINEKLVRRHPHVFGDDIIENHEEVKKKWEEIKVQVEGRPEKKGLQEVSLGLPPLERSYKIQKKAAKKGFDWPDENGPFLKIDEEIDEIKAALIEHKNRPDIIKIEEEIGDLLFSVVNLSRKLNIDPSTALHRTNQKFLKRFNHVEKEMGKNGAQMNKNNLDLMDLHWNAAKKQDR